MQYMFTGVFTTIEDGSLLVSFPDLPGLVAQGVDMVDAVKKAESALSLCLFDMEQQGLPIPEGTFPDMIALGQGETTSMVVVNTNTYHKHYGQHTAKETIHMQKWVSQLAEASGLDLSLVIQNAVRREIGVPTYRQNYFKESPPVQVPLPAPTPVEPTPEPTPPPVVVQAPEPVEIPTVEIIEPKPNPPKKIDKINTIDPITPEEMAAEELVAKQYQKYNKHGNRVSHTLAIVVLALILALCVAMAFMLTQTDVINWRGDPTHPTPPTCEPAASADNQQPTNITAQASTEALATTEATEVEPTVDPTETDPTETLPTPAPPTEPDLPTSQNGTALFELTNQPASINPAIDALQREFNNGEIVATITVAGTNIANQPVLQGYNNEFYRHHDIWAEPSPYGTIFLDSWFSNTNPGDNMVIYGPMIPGEMFYDLQLFLSPEFAHTGNSILTVNHYGQFLWEVFSVYVDPLDTPFSPANYRNWDTWIQNFAERSLIDLGVPVSEEDQAITLIGLPVDGGTNRVVVHGKLLMSTGL